MVRHLREIRRIIMSKSKGRALLEGKNYYSFDDEKLL
jgi:hypothetical protein